MKLKQLLSTALALVMTFSLSIPVFAADYETSVSYEGTGTEQYELTVPSQLKPGTAGNVTLSGTWASNRHIAVTADESVTMTGSLGGSETLDVTFAGIDLAGNNETSVSETKQVSVEELNALFGNWTGTLYYDVGASDVGNTTVDTDSGSSSGGTTNPDGSSSASDPLAGVDLSQAEGFAVTEKNRAAIGYTGQRQDLVIPAYFVGDLRGWNAGIKLGQVYKVTSIEAKAFEGCSLASVTIPEGVTSIGDSAFQSCNLTSVSIPEGVTSIGESAFWNCMELTGVTIPGSVTSIGDETFCFCRKLVNVTIDEGVTSIGAGVFSYCENLTSVSIPGSVTSIGRIAFANCENLTSIAIPEGVTSIGEAAFLYCRNLTSITIPGSVTSIGENAFLGCSKLTSINVNAKNNNYSSDDGVLLNKDKTKVIYCPEGKSGAYAVPNSVTSIESCAFSSCGNLSSVTLPEGVTSIGGSAFSGCSSLVSITIPESVTSIGKNVFNGCSNLTSINANAKNNNYSSDDGVLFNKDKTTLIKYPSEKSGATYTIPSSVTVIENYAFNDCRNLTSVSIPEGVTSIGESAFHGCRNLTNITIPEGITNIKQETFQYCSKLTSITIPESVASIGKDAFFYCKSLTSIIFNGTQGQWNAISKGTNWNNSTGSYTIYCTDGNIAK